jgi:hypothetical protein
LLCSRRPLSWSRPRPTYRHSCLRSLAPSPPSSLPSSRSTPSSLIQNTPSSPSSRSTLISWTTPPSVRRWSRNWSYPDLLRGSSSRRLMSGPTLPSRHYPKDTTDPVWFGTRHSRKTRRRGCWSLTFRLWSREIRRCRLPSMMGWTQRRSSCLCSVRLLWISQRKGRTG